MKISKKSEVYTSIHEFILHLIMCMSLTVRSDILFL